MEGFEDWRLLGFGIGLFLKVAGFGFGLFLKVAGFWDWALLEGCWGWVWALHFFFENLGFDVGWV